jgi:hypothetical protein
VKLLRVLALIALTFRGVGILPAQTRKAGTGKSIAEEKCGSLDGQILNCPKFGFTYRVIFGWVDRTADMQQDENVPDQPSSAHSSDSTSADDLSKAAGSDSSKTLLAVFERPPAAPGETINSAVVIAAEPLADYHGIKTAGDYLNPISELAQNRGFKVVSEPYEFAVGPKRLARADFNKERGKLMMWQSSMVMIEKGYIVSFTFIGGSEDEIDDLIGNLAFRTRAASKVSRGRETK